MADSTPASDISGLPFGYVCVGCYTTVIQAVQFSLSIDACRLYGCFYMMDDSLHPYLFILFRAAEKERTKKKSDRTTSHSRNGAVYK